MCIHVLQMQQATPVTPLHLWKKCSDMNVFITNFWTIIRTEEAERTPGKRLGRHLVFLQRKLRRSIRTSVLVIHAIWRKWKVFLLFQEGTLSQSLGTCPSQPNALWAITTQTVNHSVGMILVVLTTPKTYTIMLGFEFWLYNPYKSSIFTLYCYCFHMFKLCWQRLKYMTA